MQLPVDHQFISTAIMPKSISHEQICYKRSQGIVVSSLPCLFFFLASKKQRPKWISKSAASVVFALKFR